LDGAIRLLYHRLRSSEMIRAFESAGFSTGIVAMKRWQSMPTPRDAFAGEFQGLDAEELLVQVFDVVLIHGACARTLLPVVDTGWFLTDFR
jgi:hypothetical protein